MGIKCLLPKLKSEVSGLELNSEIFHTSSLKNLNYLDCFTLTKIAFSDYTFDKTEKVNGIFSIRQIKLAIFLSYKFEKHSKNINYILFLIICYFTEKLKDGTGFIFFCANNYKLYNDN